MSPKGTVQSPYSGPWTHLSVPEENYRPLCGSMKNWKDGTSQDKVTRNPAHVSCPECLYIMREIKRMKGKDE